MIESSQASFQIPPRPVHTSSQDSITMDFGLGSLLPSDVGDTMQINVSVPQRSNSMFTPTVFSQSNTQPASPFLTQPASPYIPPSQSPYIASSQGYPTPQSPFQNVMQNPQFFDSRASFNNFGPQLTTGLGSPQMGMGSPMRNLSIG
jgi:hypothetical protein